VTDAFIKLKALGLTPSEDALTSYGNTATAMGKSLNQMIEAVADAATGEFERLKEFGIKSKSQGDQVTFTFQGVSTTVGKNAKEIEAYLQSIGNVQFAGAMQEQSKTLNVALSNMGDAFSKLVKAIGDAGLTDLLTAIANGIKWLAEQITNSIEPFKLGFKAIVAEVIKFGNLFIAVFKGVGGAFNAFGEAISGRFEALGKDLAAFIENPLGGVSFENTRAALETCWMRWAMPSTRRWRKRGNSTPRSMERFRTPLPRFTKHGRRKMHRWQICLKKQKHQKKPRKPTNRRRSSPNCSRKRSASSMPPALRWKIITRRWSCSTSY
jgi:large-conductance mechanosensitive channel